MLRSFTKIIIVLLLLGISGQKIIAADKTANLTYYGDSRGFNTLAVLAAGDLPMNFKFFGFVDFHGTHNTPDARFDLSRFFLEYRLRKTISPQLVMNIQGLGLDLEYNDFAGKGNNILRAGLTFKHILPVLSNGWLQWRFFPYESDGSGMQFSLIYNFPFGDRIYLTGFADMNMDENENIWVIEPQLNINIFQNVDMVLEGRYHGYEENNPALEGQGVAIGLKVKL